MKRIKAVIGNNPATLGVLDIYINLGLHGSEGLVRNVIHRINDYVVGRPTCTVTNKTVPLGSCDGRDSNTRKRHNSRENGHEPG